MSVEEARRAAVREAEARRRGIEPWQLEMAEAVPSDLVGDIVRDQTRAAKPEPSTPVRRGTGWAPERPLESPIDSWAGRMVDADEVCGILGDEAIRRRGLPALR